ncbi:hypothetical protein, partial [Klebsiella pneumoniae]|uniref:hypothetical protein n=1 Tax=Klebsiella pneumoniae TaxID=573 RepID=UPI001D0E6B1B
MMHFSCTGLYWNVVKMHQECTGTHQKCTGTHQKRTGPQYSEKKLGKKRRKKTHLEYIQKRIKNAPERAKNVLKMSM